MPSPFTRETILQATGSGYDVFARHLSGLYPGGKIEPGRNVQNPFREQQATPSFNCYTDSTGVWRFHDFANPDDSGDCFDLVARLLGLDVRSDFPDLLRRIADDYGLNTPHPNFTLTPRPFTPEDVEYWNRSGVTVETLERFGVRSVASFTAPKRSGGTYTVRTTPRELAFAYPYGCGAWKVYRPMGERGRRFLFLGTKPAGTVWGLEHVPDRVAVLLLCAGEKDTLTAIGAGFYAVTLNSETATLSPAHVATLRSRASVIVSVYDRDATGQNAAVRLQRSYGISTVTLPDWLSERGGKDLTDFFTLGGTVEEFRTLVESAAALATPTGTTDTSATDPLVVLGAEESEEEPEGEEESEGEEEEELAERAALPLIPAEVYAALPPMLRRVVTVLERDPETQPHERDVFLTSALPVLAGAMPTVETEGREGCEGVNLYTVIVAEAGSGKGAMRYGRDLGREIDRRLYEEFTAERARWHQRYKDGETDDPAPLPVSFFIAGNSSSRAVVESLAANPCAVMVESEIRTVSATLKQDWGGFTDLLLKSYHREPVSITRKGSDRIRVEHPALSVCLSGTPEAVRELIPGVEDGLFSRIGFYRFRSVERWRSQQPRAEASELHTALRLAAGSLDSLHTVLAARTVPLVVVQTPEQWERHTAAFTGLFGLTESMLAASVKRAGVMAVRVASILAVVRVWEAEGVGIGEREEVEVSDAEALAGVMLAATYLRHAAAIAATLPKRGGTKMHGRKQAFFESLPVGVFRTATALDIAARLDIRVRTAKDYLRCFTDAGLLLKSDHGEYTKSADLHSCTFCTLPTSCTLGTGSLNQRAESAGSAESAEVQTTPPKHNFRVA